MAEELFSLRSNDNLRIICVFSGIFWMFCMRFNYIHWIYMKALFSIKILGRKKLIVVLYFTLNLEVCLHGHNENIVLVVIYKNIKIDWLYNMSDGYINSDEFARLIFYTVRKYSEYSDICIVNLLVPGHIEKYLTQKPNCLSILRWCKMNLWERLNSVFWSEWFWLPSNTTWSSLKNKPGSGVYYPENKDLLVTVALALVLYLIRQLYEK